MTESIGISESVSVEIVRANPSFGIPSIPSTGASAISFEYIFIIIGIIIAIGFIFLAVRKYSAANRQPSKLPKFHKTNLSTDSTGVKFLKSLGIAALFGFIGLFLSTNPLTWVLASAIFYYEFFIKRK